MHHWDDLVPGQKFATKSITLNQQDIVDFAREFDPQPYHLNPEAGEASIFGGLCASGWQVCALMMRLLTEAFRLNGITLMGVQEVSLLRWRKPVFANDQLMASAVIKSTQSNSGRAGLGAVNCDIELCNHQQEVLLTLNSTLLVPHTEGKEAAPKGKHAG